MKILFIFQRILLYIEIPNCFEDYLSKFSILNIFIKENITFENMPKFNFPEKIIKNYKRTLLIN